MGHWGWRQLFAVFISVWVVGCSTTHDAAPTLSPTQLPKITLTSRPPLAPTPHFTPQYTIAMIVPVTPTPVVYAVQPGDTLLQIARRFGVDPGQLQIANGGLEPRSLQIGQLLSIPAPVFDVEGNPTLPTSTPLNLPLIPPTCYPTPTNHILCLGQVTNPLGEAIQRVTVTVSLLREDGSLLAEGQAGIEQHVIPPGRSAPYRILLKADWRAYAGSAARVQSADSAPGAEQRFVPLEVYDREQQTADGHFEISAILHNPDAQIAHLRRVIVTLSDGKGQITGYRVIQLDHLLIANESFPLEISVISQVPGRPAQHTVYVEAERAPVIPG
jgi:LysM repeat protein